MRFDHRSLGAVFGRALRTGETAASAADADEIEYLVGHGDLLVEIAEGSMIRVRLPHRRRQDAARLVESRR